MWVYKHDYFVRDQPELLEMVKRKTPTASPTASPLLDADAERKLQPLLHSASLMRSSSAPPESARTAHRHPYHPHQQHPDNGYENFQSMDYYAQHGWGHPPQRRGSATDME